MPNIEKLKLQDISQTIDSHLIEDLEIALEKAQDGNIIGYSLVIVRPDHSSLTMSYNKCGPLELIGALSVALIDEIKGSEVKREN